MEHAAEPTEARLQAALLTPHDACRAISLMMPGAARQFRQSHQFEDRTVDLVRQLWFVTTDAIAALKGRGQLKRPKVWDPLRSTVMSPAAA